MPAPILTVHVVEVGMATPDIVCMVIRDQDVQFKGLLQLASPDLGAPGSWSAAANFGLVQRDPVTGGAGTDWCHVVGQLNGVKCMFQHFGHAKPTAFLDRTAVDNPANWSLIGSRTVTNVYRKSKPFGQGLSYTGASTFYNVVAMEHHVFLKLNGNLAQGGPYTISVAGNTFPPYNFTFNDRVSRSISLRASQSGYRASEKSKKANLQLWIPGYGTEGRVNFATTYGLTTAELIDDKGITVFTGPMTLLIDAVTVDPLDTIGGDGLGNNYEYASTVIPPKVATSVVNGAGITTLGFASPHGFSSGQRKYIQGFGSSMASGTLSGIENKYTITVTDATHFTIPVVGNTWVQGNYRPGYDSLVFDIWVGNRWATNVYQFDFSAFDAMSFQGNYRVRVPGLGVSDQFTLMEHTRFSDAKIYAQGYYNQLQGMDLDPAFGGWDRPASFRDGNNGVQIYESLCPGSFTGEAILLTSGTNMIVTCMGCLSSFTFSAPLITGNSVSGTINGNAWGPVPFNGTASQTMTDICTAIATALPGVETSMQGNSICAYTHIGSTLPQSTRYTFTATVTGGASQPTVRLTPWLTSTRITVPFVTIRDAGDWDWHQATGNEGSLPYLILEYGYVNLPSPARDVHFGFPKASALNPVLYAGTDNLGDQFHMAIYQIDAFRATQKGDGRVYSGMNYAQMSLPAVGGGDHAGGYNVFEPSQYSVFPGVLLAADPPSNVMYAASAAKVAQVLLDAGFTTAGNTWKTSAINAWNWAEGIYQDWLANGVTGTVVDGYFNGTCHMTTWGVGTQGFIDSAKLSSQLSIVLGSVYTGTRLWAAGALYRMTKDNTYGTIIAPLYTSGTSGDTGHGLWDFANTDPATLAAHGYTSQAAYLNGRWTSGVDGSKNPDLLARAALSSTPDQNNQFLKYIHDKLNYSQGINQENLTRVAGLGYRYPSNFSNRDREAMGRPSSEVIGSAMLFHFAGQQAYGGNFHYSTDSPTNSTVIYPTSVGLDPLWASKVVTPFPTSRPFEESLNDSTNAIFQTESQAFNPNGNHFYMAMIAHCLDSNSVVAPVAGKYKRRLTCTA